VLYRALEPSEYTWKSIYKVRKGMDTTTLQPFCPFGEDLAPTGLLYASSLSVSSVAPVRPPLVDLWVRSSCG